MDTNSIVDFLIYCAALVAFIILMRRDMRIFEKMHNEKCDPWLLFSKIWRFGPIDKTDKYQVVAHDYVVVGGISLVAFVLSEHFFG